MEENIDRELQVLKGMVLAWKKSYLASAPPEGGGEFLAREFLEEIEMHISPYTRRMYECHYLSAVEATEFLDFCFDQVADLRDSLRMKEDEHA